MGTESSWALRFWKKKASWYETWGFFFPLSVKIQPFVIQSTCFNQQLQFHLVCFTTSWPFFIQTFGPRCAWPPVSGPSTPRRGCVRWVCTSFATPLPLSAAGHLIVLVKKTPMFPRKQQVWPWTTSFYKLSIWVFYTIAFRKSEYRQGSALLPFAKPSYYRNISSPDLSGRCSSPLGKKGAFGQILDDFGTPKINKTRSQSWSSLQDLQSFLG